ncbi:hypothetical protein [Mucilaginibacter lacusdianchii]|uniref:hypothetical protein n=1 Tax=Mucilaginibacter lacusdianchii TaxID=2684211 RepID=UPI00131BDBCE|nr:hypothetical protein [Mucilaginibacter sp. JXJ CY 39]
MDKPIQDFIESGILETYVTGTASEAEEKEVLYMKNNYPEVKTALADLEVDMEKLAQHMAIAPPSGLWNRIEAEFNELTVTPNETALKLNREQQYRRNESDPKGPNYIEVEAESTHMRIHKAWKWVFAAVFILGKIFLACAIYFYLENRQAQQSIQELKQEVRELKKR